MGTERLALLGVVSRRVVTRDVTTNVVPVRVQLSVAFPCQGGIKNHYCISLQKLNFKQVIASSFMKKSLILRFCKKGPLKMTQNILKTGKILNGSLNKRILCRSHEQI